MTPKKAVDLRMALILSLALTLALVGLLVAAPLLVDRDRLLRRVEAEIAAAGGPAVRIDAVRELRLLPTPRVELGPLQVLPPVGALGQAPATPPLSAHSLRLDLALPALLLARVEPVALRLDGLDIDWQPGVARPPPLWLAALRLPQLAVQAGTLRIDYPAGARRLHWPLLQQQRPWRPHPQSGPLRVSARFPHADTPAAGALQLEAELATAGLPEVAIAPLRLSGGLPGVGQWPALDLSLSAERITRDADGHWRFDGLLLDADGLQLTGAAQLPAQTGPRRVLAGQLALATTDLRAWLTRHLNVPLPGRDDTLRCVSAAARLSLDGDLLRISPLTLELDRTRAAAAATLRLGPMPRAAVALRLDALDLDAYSVLPPSTAAVSAIAASPAPADCGGDADAEAPPPAPPAAPADGVDLHIALVANALRAAGLNAGALDGTLTQRGAHTTTDLTAAAFYGGRLRLRGEHALYAAAPPRLTLRAEAEEVDLGALLTDLTGQPQLTGTAEATAELAADAGDLAQMRRDLSGSVRIEVRDGRLLALTQAAAQFGPLLNTVGLELDADSTAFSRLGLTAVGRDGVFRSDDLAGRARLLRLDGTGVLDVVAETIAADLSATLVQRPDGPDLKGLDGIQVPIRVAGPVASPEIDADVAPALAEAARRAARRHLDGDDNLFQQLEEATGVEGLEQGLRGLFGL
jgi:hypothetical protein